MPTARRSLNRSWKTRFRLDARPRLQILGRSRRSCTTSVHGIQVKIERLLVDAGLGRADRYRTSPLHFLESNRSHVLPRKLREGSCRKRQTKKGPALLLVAVRQARRKPTGLSPSTTNEGPLPASSRAGEVPEDGDDAARRRSHPPGQLARPREAGRMLAGGTCHAAPRSLSTATGLDHLVGGLPRSIGRWSSSSNCESNFQPDMLPSRAFILGRKSRSMSRRSRKTMLRCCPG